MSFAGLLPHMPSPGEVNVGTFCHTGQDGRASECRRQTSNSSDSRLKHELLKPWFAAEIREDRQRQDQPAISGRTNPPV